MEKRAFERVDTSLSIRYFCGNLFYTGTVRNLSGNGMFISTKVQFPFSSGFELLLPLKKEILRLPVKVTRIVKTDGFYNGMGVELLNPDQNYLEFVDTLKSADL